MANSLTIEIGEFYKINGDIFQLAGIYNDYFTLIPIKINNIYHTSSDGFITMRSSVFSKAEIYKGEL